MAKAMHMETKDAFIIPIPVNLFYKYNKLKGKTDFGIGAQRLGGLRGIRPTVDNGSGTKKGRIGGLFRTPKANRTPIVGTGILNSIH
jgi:hypothetical protein